MSLGAAGSCTEHDRCLGRPTTNLLYGASLAWLDAPLEQHAGHAGGWTVLGLSGLA